MGTLERCPPIANFAVVASAAQGMQAGDAAGEKQAMTLPITLTIAGAAALISIWLALRVSLLRRRDRVSIGHGGNAAIEGRMRAHANFVEYTPFFLILLGLIEAARGSQTWLWIAAILFILGRLAHPFGMERPAPNALRIVSIVVTWGVLLGLAAYAISIPYLQRTQPSGIQYAVLQAPSPSTGTKLS
jgi:uncharacterized membrane protein YecN with MAPEG domain